MNEQQGVRPYAIAGAIVASAGFIAINPIAGLGTDVQDRDVRLMSVESAADVLAVSPDQPYTIATPEQLFTDTIDNLESLNTQIANDPSPILDQILINQAAYSNDIATAVENASQDMTTEMQDLSNGLQSLATGLSSGDVYDALYTNLGQVLLGDQLTVTQDLTNGFSEVSQGIAQNIFNVLNDSVNNGALPVGEVSGITPEWLTDIMDAPLYGPNAAMAGFAGVADDVVTAANNGDYTTVFSDLLNAPSTVLDAFLNGYDEPLSVAPRVAELAPDLAQRFADLDPSYGLLTAEGGFGGFRGGFGGDDQGGIESLLAAQRDIAANLGAESFRRFDSLADVFSNNTGTLAAPDLSALLTDLSNAVNPGTLLGDLTALVDGTAAADIGAQLSTDLSSVLLSLF